MKRMNFQLSQLTLLKPYNLNSGLKLSPCELYIYVWLIGDTRSWQEKNPHVNSKFGSISQPGKKSVVCTYDVSKPRHIIVLCVLSAEGAIRILCVLYKVTELYTYPFYTYPFHIHFIFAHSGTNRQKLLLQKVKLIAFNTSHPLGWRHNYYFYVHFTVNSN
jgi:hypothetical protein